MILYECHDRVASCDTLGIYKQGVLAALSTIMCLKALFYAGEAAYLALWCGVNSGMEPEKGFIPSSRVSMDRASDRDIASFQN